MSERMFKLPEDILKEVINALKEYIEDSDAECEYWSCPMCESRGKPCSYKTSVTLHKLESGCELV